MLSLYDPTKTRKSVVAINHHNEPYILGNREVRNEVWNRNIRLVKSIFLTRVLLAISILLQEPSDENLKSVLSSLTWRSTTQPLSSCWCSQEEMALRKCHRDKKDAKEDLKQCDILQMKLLRCNKERANKCAALAP